MYDMTQSPGYRPALGAGGGRGSMGGGMNTLHAPSNMPPPYRAPPHNMAPPPGPPTPKTGPGQAPYSRFNTSEPHLAGQYKSSPVPGYRHTINHENSSSVQNNLKQMLAMPKHNTLDIHGQNMAIQHLRNQGMAGDRGGPGQYPYNGQSSGNTPGPDSSYGGPDSLRNTANKMFSRGQAERSSGLNGQPPQPPGGYPGYQGQPYGHNTGGLNTSLNQSLNHSVDMGPGYQETRGQRIRQNSAEDPNKRNSYGNQSFRAAVIQSPGPQPGPAKPGPRQPPQVPPKPGARSREASRERPRELRDAATEENDHLETELKNILRGNKEFDKTNGQGTPPLPALSPGQSANQTPQSSPDFRAKYKMNQTPTNLNNRPDLLENENPKKMQERPMPGHKTGPPGRRPGSLGPEGSTLPSAGQHGPPGKDRLKDPRGRGVADQGPEHDMASTTTGLDLESVMALQTDLTSDEELSTTIDLSDAQAIRKQLDGLENMYTEVLKLLGLRKFGRPPANGDVKTGIARRKMYGSMSSLPSVSSIGSRHLYGKDKRREGAEGGRSKRPGGRDKTHTKRFQRLESHVVTLARSVAHLSSEMRTQHVIVQEIEQIRQELQQVKLSRGQHTGSLPRGGVLEPQEFFSHHPRVSQQTENRVKKLTKFFGDEPPLLRLYLKNLGYEKYASIFEEAKIGMLELPYLSEERLEKLGLPLGPRIRILQEVKQPYNMEGQNYNVYIL